MIAVRRVHYGAVAATVIAHLGYLVYLPSGGFLALRWRRTFWLHVPAVCWGIAVTRLELPCPLTALESRARAWAQMKPLPANGFVDRYISGIVVPNDRIESAQKLAFLAVAVSWIALAVQILAEQPLGPNPRRRLEAALR